VRPTNFAPHLSAKCSAPYDKSQLAKINSPSQASIKGKLDNPFSPLDTHYKRYYFTKIDQLLSH
jgi:hypothetical protein